PGLAEQIGGGHALFAAAFEQPLQVLALVVLQAAVQVAVGDFPGQVQGTEDHLAGLVPGVVGPVTEEQALGMDAADGPADVVAQAAQTGSGGGQGGSLRAETAAV